MVCSIRETIVSTSRFVRVILAQGPCYSSPYRSDLNGRSPKGIRNTNASSVNSCGRGAWQVAACLVRLITRLVLTVCVPWATIAGGGCRVGCRSRPMTVGGGVSSIIVVIIIWMIIITITTITIITIITIMSVTIIITSITIIITILSLLSLSLLLLRIPVLKELLRSYKTNGWVNELRAIRGIPLIYTFLHRYLNCNLLSFVVLYMSLGSDFPQHR